MPPSATYFGHRLIPSSFNKHWYQKSLVHPHVLSHLARRTFAAGFHSLLLNNRPSWKNQCSDALNTATEYFTGSHALTYFAISASGLGKELEGEGEGGGYVPRQFEYGLEHCNASVNPEWKQDTRTSPFTIRKSPPFQSLQWIEWLTSGLTSQDHWSHAKAPAGSFGKVGQYPEKHFHSTFSPPLTQCRALQAKPMISNFHTFELTL